MKKTYIIPALDVTRVEIHESLLLALSGGTNVTDIDGGTNNPENGGEYTGEDDQGGITVGARPTTPFSTEGMWDTQW